MISLQPQVKVALFFTIMGGIAGALSTIVRSGWTALFLAIVIYIFSSSLARRILKLQQSDFPTSKVLSSGFGPFFLVWLISWIWIYTALL